MLLIPVTTWTTKLMPVNLFSSFLLFFSFPSSYNYLCDFFFTVTSILICYTFDSYDFCLLVTHLCDALGFAVHKQRDIVPLDINDDAEESEDEELPIFDVQVLVAITYKLFNYLIFFNLRNLFFHSMELEISNSLCYFCFA